MNTLLQKYKALLTDRGIDADSYTRQRLKLRLKSYFVESIVFHQQPDHSQPELVYSSKLSLQTVINAAFKQSSCAWTVGTLCAQRLLHFYSDPSDAFSHVL